MYLRTKFQVSSTILTSLAAFTTFTFVRATFTLYPQLPPSQNKPLKSLSRLELNSSKLDWEENLFDFYVESIAFRINMCNFNLIINDSHLYASNMAIGIYHDQTQAIK